MKNKHCALILMVLSLLVTHLSAAVTDYRKGTYFYVGYSANIPKQLIGLNLYLSLPKFVGFTFDLKSEMPGLEQISHTEPYSVSTVTFWGDSFIRTDGQWMSVNGALTVPIMRSISLYGGAGASIYHEYRRYYDDLEILGKNGYYWINDDSKTKTKINYLGGILLKLSNDFAAQIGAQSEPFGIVAGISYKISFTDKKLDNSRWWDGDEDWDE
jgi:hypothetical protein